MKILGFIILSSKLCCSVCSNYFICADAANCSFLWCSLLKYAFLDLVYKGNKVTEEEVVNSVAELSLHPHYTIPLLGCFRPIAQKIVDRAVDLLHHVSDDLRSNSDEQGEDSGYLGDAEVVAVIQFHVNSRSGLRLHELACLAFCRVLDLAPFLLE